MNNIYENSNPTPRRTASKLVTAFINNFFFWVDWIYLKFGPVQVATKVPQVFILVRCHLRRYIWSFSFENYQHYKKRFITDTSLSPPVSECFNNFRCLERSGYTTKSSSEWFTANTFLAYMYVYQNQLQLSYAVGRWYWLQWTAL